ncbi:unnamed protein product [Rangifer tarandus platyrhynchus]|uniref:Uncharacterized protein n=2 Tax=Rangifer tarandus platyrhynchus TaxID=3082113 RepID=A0ACB0E634_RANTA|nr:unnamed protein product [Rangifer tarandus platyrhynchus]CAI9695884.1 unnamed protein product [Rangifer tarandus platyrhynchus]
MPSLTDESLLTLAVGRAQEAVTWIERPMRWSQQQNRHRAGVGSEELWKQEAIHRLRQRSTQPSAEKNGAPRAIHRLRQRSTQPSAEKNGAASWMQDSVIYRIPVINIPQESPFTILPPALRRTAKKLQKCLHGQSPDNMLNPGWIPNSRGTCVPQENGHRMCL